MTVISTLVVEIISDISGYLDGINKASETTSSFAGSAVDGLSALGGGIVAGALAAGVAGVTAMGFALSDAAGEAMAAEAIMAQTSAVIESTGGAAGMTADEVANLAGALSEVTTFEDDTIQGAENMLLTFTSIGKDVFPTATETVLDMSQALGQDLKSSAIQLGKALQDPVAGVSALARVGVNFTDEQKLMIEQMVKAGDTMGAQKFILAELNREFGGSARAAAETAAGGWTVFINKIGNIKEEIAGGLLPVFGSLTNTLSDLLEREDVKKFIDDFTNSITWLAQTAVDGLPQFAAAIENGFNWLMENKGVIVAALAIVGAAVLAFAYTSLVAAIPGLITFLGAAWPVILVMGLIGGAAYLLYTAWEQNWGGIREKTAAAWAFMKPLIDDIVQWFQTYIPYAWSVLQQFWNGTMAPMFQNVYDWLKTNIPIAVAILQLKWGELQNSMFMVADWVEKHLTPMFTELGDLLGIFMPVVLRAVSTLWTGLANVIGQYVYQSFANLLGILNVVGGILGWVGTIIDQGIQMSFATLTIVIDAVTSSVHALVNALNTVVLPGWLGGDTTANILAQGQSGGGSAGGGGYSAIAPDLRVMPGIQMTYVDNATVRSGETADIIDKLGPALAQYLRQLGLLP